MVELWELVAGIRRAKLARKKRAKRIGNNPKVQPQPPAFGERVLFEAELSVRERQYRAIMKREEAIAERYAQRMKEIKQSGD
jgi:hypothetical protein